MTIKKKTQDADLSNAGDDFHVLWTMQKSFEMLNFDDNGLKAIYIEDVERNFSLHSDPTGEKLLGIDLSEYYGGKDFEKANRIVVSQLKYSTRKAKDPYTFSELYKGKKSDSYNGSIIHRLASAYKTFIDSYDEKEVQKKIIIKLVSNRNINPVQLEVLSNIKTYLKSNKRKISFNKVLNQDFIKYKKSLINLRSASKLSLTEFTDFLRILDFDDCGVNSRNAIKLDLVKAISETAVTYKTQYNALYLMIWDKCMPESDNSRILTVTNLIASLGFDGGSVENLFPVKQNFVELKEQVRREQLDEILNVLNKKKSRIICLHGGAGIGKSTIVQQIKQNLPKFSECIIFDCYGMGAYQYSSDRRHLPKYGLVQIANDIAKKIGTSFLLNRGESNDVYIRELEKRLHKGVEILTRRNPKATLNIIIDAADNSVVAAKIHNELSFTQLLVNSNIPEGCNIIFTTRTFRKGTLNMPNDSSNIPLKSFSQNETEIFVKNHFPYVKIEQVEEFHKYTDGVPRAQFYALDLKLNGINELINYLKPNGKKVEDFILDKIKEAENRLGDSDKHLISNFLKLLITLPRPVPLEYLAEIMQVEKDVLHDLKSELWTGLICNDNQFEFRDEDFENFIRKEYILDDNELSKIADVFLIKSELDFYAAKSLGFILYNANRYDDLKKNVLERKNLDSILDPVRKKEIYIDRVKQAIKLSKSENDFVTLFKLIFIAAEEAKTDKALSDLLINHPELILQYGDEYSLQKFKLNSEETTWGGSFHLKLAAAYSRSNKEVAIRHLNTAKEWLNWKHSNKEELENDFNNDYNISSIDISCETEAVLRLYGVESSVKSLFRWTPESIRLFSGNHLIKSLFQFSSDEEISDWLKSAEKLRLDIQIFLVTKLFQYKREIHYDLKKLVLKTLRCKRIKFDIRFHSVLVDFCEILLFKDKYRDEVSEILASINYDVPMHIPYFRNQFDDGKDEISMDLALRSKILKASISNETISLNHIYPNKFNDIDKIEDYEKRRHLESDKQEFDNFYSFNLLIYQLRSKMFLNETKIDDLISEFQDIYQKINSSYDFDYKAGHRSQDQKLFFVSKLSKLIGLLNKKSLIINVLTSFKKMPYTGIRFTILNTIQYLREFDDISLKILNEIDKKLDEINVTSQELIDDYIKCTFISSKIDKEVGKYFFEKSIESVKEIEYDEAFSKIRCLYSLTRLGINKANPELAYKYARFVEYCDVSLDGYEKKHFPYENALMGIANIDLPSMFSIICRWHHRNVVDIGIYAFSVLNKSFKNKFLSHKEVTSLLPLYELNHYSATLIDFYESILYKFDENQDIKGKTDFVAALLRRYKSVQDKSILKKIYEKVKSGAFIKQVVLDDLSDYINFLNQIEETEKDAITNHYPKQDYNHNIDIDSLDLNSTLELEAVIEQITLRDENYGRWKVDRFLSDIMSKINVSEYTTHLDAIVRIDSNVLSYYSLNDALKQRLKDWSYHPSVNRWKEENFKYVLSSWFHHFNEHRRFSVWSVNELVGLFSLEENLLADTILEIIPEKIDELSDESLYDIFELIKLKLSKDENEQLLVWALERWSIKVKEDVSDGVWNKSLIPPQNKDEVLANLLRFLLGHPNKLYRWRAIHSLKNLSDSNIDVLKHLLEKQNIDNCYPFQNRNYRFYWISAKLYLWIAIDKISIDDPSLILPFKSILMVELQNTDLPHVLIKYFVKKTCLNLIEANPNSFEDYEKEIINDCLESNFEKVEEERLSRKQRKYNSNKDGKWRFDFDTMDTLPYWYSSLGEIFNLTKLDVADLADKYIVEKWGYTGDAHEDDYLSNQLYNDDWRLTRKGSGSNPQIETLETYFEYHSMFCAANDLLINEPQVLEDAYWRSWDKWLKSNANTWNKFWVSDLVDSIPLQEKYWKIEYSKFDKDWRDNIEEDKFDKEVGINNFYNDRFIVPHGYIKRYMGDNTEMIYIRSALVSPKSSEALLRALQTVKNHHDYALPIEKDGNENEIDELGFELKSWIKYNENETQGKGLDEHDSLFQDIGYSFACLADKVLDLFPIELTEDFKTAFLNDKLIMKNINWNDVTNESYRSSNLLQSEAAILEVDFDFILSVLNRTKKYMIIECHVEKQIKERDYNYQDNKSTWEHTKMYLIKTDGTIKTIRR